jgi:hypothetical protein
MNWRRCIFRIWLVGSAVWIAATVGLTYRYGEQHPWSNAPIVHTFDVQTPNGNFQVKAIDQNDAVKAVQTYLDKNGPVPDGPWKQFPTVLPLPPLPPGFELDKKPETASIDGEPDHNELWDAQFWLLEVLAPPISAAMALLCVGWILGGFQSKSRALGGLVDREGYDR